MPDLWNRYDPAIKNYFQKMEDTKMPGRDRTGPMGMGAMTGRGAGCCAETGLPGQGQAGTAPGWGFGMGLRAGRGGRMGRFGGYCQRNMFYATGLPGYLRMGSRAVAPVGYSGFGYPTPSPEIDPELEKEALRRQQAAIQTQLDIIKKRLSEIEPDTTVS
jgi:hypothetical protein